MNASTLARPAVPAKSARQRCVQTEAQPEADDSKYGAIAKLLKKVGFAPTAGAAHQEMQRTRAKLAVITSMAVTAGLDRELDEYLEAIDEVRTGGIALEASNAATTTMAKVDAADNPARELYLIDSSDENARALFNTTKRLHIACLEQMRILRTKHPVLRSC